MKTSDHPSFDFSRPLVIGCGVSGRAAALFLKSLHTHVTIAEKFFAYVTQEKKQWQHQEIHLLHETELSSLASYSLIIASPGLPPDHFLLAQAKKEGIPVIGEMELALRFLRARAIGITGTNGKTSVTSLTHHILSRCGVPCHAVGNIGVPVTEALLKLPPNALLNDLFIIEMSSFQLDTLSLPVLDQGAIVNLTPNHLNHHGTMQEYARAKCSISACIKPGGVLHVHPDVLQNYASLLQTDCIKTLETHLDPYLENAATAFALCSPYGITLEQFNTHLATWQLPKHRRSFVREKEGVRYYNDSKASNLVAVEKAIYCMPGPVLLLAGGVHKGASYRYWVEPFKGKVRELFVFGEAALQIEKELGMFFPVTRTSSLLEALHIASSKACKGDNILLSPGCSSYDMFKDYIHRGESFEKWVKEL